MTPDFQLLRDYAERQVQPAFAELVRRQVDLVYSVARRLVVDAHLAEDVTQSVFAALALQAGDVAQKLEQGTPLSGWLHVTTRHLASKVVRTEERRRAREQEMIRMQDSPDSESDATWDQVAPQLDDALAELEPPDRDAVILRYFERKTAREIGTQLGLSEAAAQKRVSRALDRLRLRIEQRGLMVSSGTLATVIALNAVKDAPAALAATLSAGFIAPAATGTIVTSLGSFMASTSLKVGLTALVAAGLMTTLHQRRQNRALEAELVALRAEAAVTPAAVTSPVAAPPSEELLRLRGEVAQLRREKAGFEQLRAENARLRAATAGDREAAGTHAEREAFEALAISRMNDGRNWAMACLLFAEGNGDVAPLHLSAAASHFPQGEETGDRDPNQFEIVYQGSLKDIAAPARTILLREKEAWPNFDKPGTCRTYVFADGHSEIKSAPDGVYDAWERERGMK